MSGDQGCRQVMDGTMLAFILLTGQQFGCDKAEKALTLGPAWPAVPGSHAV